MRRQPPVALDLPGCGPAARREAPDARIRLAPKSLDRGRVERRQARLTGGEQPPGAIAGDVRQAAPGHPSGDGLRGPGAPMGRDDNEVEIQFKEFGVRLAFTPTVLSSNRISLRVSPEVSDLDFANAIELVDTLIPALRSRRAETTVELGSGQSFAIGGLISNSTQNNIDKLPGLGDLPVLGALFRSTSFQRSESELVIIVTPYLVQPVRANELTDPTERYRAPSDLTRILDARLAKRSIAPGYRAPVISGGRLVGPAGFLID